MKLKNDYFNSNFFRSYMNPPHTPKKSVAYYIELYISDPDNKFDLTQKHYNDIDWSVI